MADEQKLTKLQQVLGDNTEKTQAKIKAIEQELENERRKSMADERKVKEL